MGNRHDNIKNEIAYFYTVIKNMDMKESIKLSKIKDNEVLTDIIQDVYSISDEYFCENSLLDWIELIENPNLHKAIKSLSIKEQTLLSYIFYKEKTQSEVAKIYNISRPAITKMLSKIINKIKFISRNRLPKIYQKHS